MTREVAVLPEETAITSIQEREKLILNKVGAYVSRYHPELAGTLRLTGYEGYRFKEKRSTREPGPPAEAYLDIETTGLSPYYSEITVISHTLMT